MTETIAPDSEPRSDDVSFIRVVNVFLRHRRLFVLLPASLVLIAVIVSVLQPRLYSASASFMPQSSQPPLNDLASTLATRMGVNFRSGAGEQSPLFYARLLESRVLLWQAATSEYDLPPSEEGDRRNQLIDALGVAAGSERDRQYEAVRELRELTDVSVDRETGIVTISARAASPSLAEQIVAHLLELVNEYNLTTRRSQAVAEGEFIEERLVEAQEELTAAETELQEFLKQNRMFSNSPQLSFEHDRLQRMVGMQQGIVNSLMQAREQARIEAVRETPVITVIESSLHSARPQARGTVLRGILAGIAGLSVATLLAFMLEFMRRTRVDHRDAYLEFNALKQAALDDVRLPLSKLGLLRGRTAHVS